MAEPKQPIRLTHQRAEALLAVFDAGVKIEEQGIREDVQWSRFVDASQADAVRQRDVRLAAAKDAAAIIRHRYLHGEEPTTPHETLF